MGDDEQVRQDSVFHQGQMGGAQRGPPFQDASLCLPREGQFYATAFRGPRSIRHWQATFFSASQFLLKKAPRPVPQHLLRVTIKIHLCVIMQSSGDQPWIVSLMLCQALCQVQGRG